MRIRLNVIGTGIFALVIALSTPAYAAPAQLKAANDVMHHQASPVGCDLTKPDYRNNPLCQNISDKEREARLTLKELLANPAFQCADGRNAGLGWHDLTKFSPCPTGALRLRLSWGTLRLVHTTDSARVYHHAVPADGEFYSAKHGWDYYLNGSVAVKENGKTAYHYSISYKASQGITPYKSLIRMNGGDWDTVGNLDDLKLDSKASYDILVTWTEPGRKTPAWLPVDALFLKNLL